MNLKKENLILASLSVLLGRMIAPRFVVTPEFRESIEKLIRQIQEAVQENSETSKKKKK